MPAPPRDLLAWSVGVWETYWTSDIARLAQPVDRVTIVERWIEYIDDWRRCRNAYRKQRVVHGSTGQPVVNKLGARMLELEAIITRLEMALGISPLGRMKLGIAFGDAAKSLKELNDAADSDEDADDPRAALVESAVDVGWSEASEPRR